jgi:hypothetical protein
MLRNIPNRSCLASALVAFVACPALAETAKMADSFVDSIGVNMHVGSAGDYNSAWTAISNAMAASGIRHVRDYFWNGATFTTYGRPLINQFHTATGLDIKYMLTQQSGCTPGAFNPASPLAYGMSTTNIFGFEGLNEWNGWGSSHCPNWVADVRNSQNSIWNARKGTPGISALAVIGPSIGDWNGQQSQVAADVNAVGSLTAVMDYGNIHDYCTNTKPSCHFSWMASTMAPMNGTKPAIVSETGYTNGDVNQAVANKYFSRLFFDWFNFGATRAYVYELLDQPVVGTWEGQFGLLNANGSYKPAFTTISNIIAILKDPGPKFTPGDFSYTTTGGDSFLSHTLLQKRNGTYYLALWQDHNSWDAFSSYNVTVNFTSPRNVNQYDPLTSASPTTVWNNVSSVVVPVTDQTVMLEIAPNGTPCQAPTL